MGANVQTDMVSFFANSRWLAYEVLRPLSHILSSWELTWIPEQRKYLEEEESYAALLNALIRELETASPPPSYHDNEDQLAEYVIRQLNWPIRKVGNRWVGEDYDAIIEQGGFNDLNQHDLMLAAAGRIRVAINRRQTRFDNMEKMHRRMLAAVLSIILYHRTPNRREIKEEA